MNGFITANGTWLGLGIYPMANLPGAESQGGIVSENDPSVRIASEDAGQTIAGEN